MRRRAFIKAASGLFVPAVLGRAAVPLSLSDPAFVGRHHPSGSSVTPPTADPNLFAWFSTDTNCTISDNGTIQYFATGANRWITRGGSWTYDGINNGFFGANCGDVVKMYAGKYTSSGLPSGVPAFHIDTGSSPAGALGTSGAFSINQPVSIYMLARFDSWADGHFAIDLGNNHNEIAQRTSSPNIALYAGSSVTALTSCSLNTWHVLTAVYNGASSSLQVDNLTAATGNPGTGGSSGGATLGVYSGSCTSANTMVGDIAAVILSAAANNATIQAIHKNWLANYGGISI